jgi:hypothetical protein
MVLYINKHSFSGAYSKYKKTEKKGEKGCHINMLTP